jgi:hypothetical protein
MAKKTNGMATKPMFLSTNAWLMEAKIKLKVKPAYAYSFSLAGT